MGQSARFASSHGCPGHIIHLSLPFATARLFIWHFGHAEPRSWTSGLALLVAQLHTLLVLFLCLAEREGRRKEGRAMTSVLERGNVSQGLGSKGPHLGGDKKREEDNGKKASR